MKELVLNKEERGRHVMTAYSTPNKQDNMLCIPQGLKDKKSCCSNVTNLTINKEIIEWMKHGMAPNIDWMRSQ